MSKPNVLIAFTTSNALYARVLRWLMQDRVHHALLFYESPFLGWLALEIDEDGVHLVHPNRALKRITKMECYETDYDLTVGMLAMKHYIGSKYDWLGLLSGAWRLLLFRLFGYVSKHGTHVLSRMFCSEVVTGICQYSGMQTTTELVMEDTWPPLLRDTIVEDPKVRRTENPFDQKYEFAA